MRTRCLVVITLIFWSSLSTSPWAQNQGNGLAIIVNKANPTEELSFVELRKIFLAERTRWPEGELIMVAMRDTGQSERGAILQSICQMNESEFNRYFLQATFTGAVQSPPKRFSTVIGIRDFVAAVPGAIGYVRVSDLNASVKPLRVNGRLPNDPGYELVVQTP